MSIWEVEKMTMNHSFDGLEEIVDVPETFIPDEANEE
jgi:hypothetical protein